MRIGVFKAFASIVLLFFLVLCFSGTSEAQENLESQSAIKKIQAEVSQLKTKIDEQQKKIDELENSKSEGKLIENVSSSKVTGNGGILGGVKASSIPEIGVVGDIVGTSSDSLDNDEGNDRISMRELELVIGSDVDPYSRFDSTLTFSDSEDPDVEEAYVSYWGLPGEIKGRLGRVHQNIGKASATHRDALETVDEPLVIQEYLGVEGLFKTGVDFSGFTPISSEIFTQQVTIGMIEGGVGEEGQLLGESRNQPTFYGRLSNFLNISDSTNYELGGSYLLGSADEDSAYEVNAFGIDNTFVHYFTPTNKFKMQSELFISSRDDNQIEGEDGAAVTYDSHATGLYVLADLRLSQSWSVGTRYDWVEPIENEETNCRDEDQAYSGYLTFFQSEFARWRFQYQYAQLANGEDDNRYFVQGTFGIGTHKHQIQ